MSTVVGRDAELAHLRDLLGRAGSGSPAVAVIQGEAGCGKTALLNAVVESAVADGWRCLRVQGVESEAVLAGAGLLTLLSPLRDDLPALPDHQAAVLSGALGWGPVAGPGDRFLIGAATLGLLAAAASASRLLIAVDDLQWVDAESVDALAFAARRLGHDQVAVMLTHRAGAPLPAALDGFEVLGLEGLGPSAAEALLGPGFATEVVATLVSETAGNPLALLECQRALSRAQRTGAAPLPPALPVPARLQQVYAGDLAALTPGAWRAALLCAASHEQDAAPVLAALAAEGADPGGCLAEAGDVLVAEAGTLRFRHPLLRAAAWDRASAVEQASAHAALAELVPGRSARAWHRAEATPGHDAALAAELAEVAEADRSRRGFATASRAGERAARLTPDPELKAQWLAVASDDAYVAGDNDRARRLAGEVLESDAGDGARAQVLVTLGLLELSHGTFARAREFFDQAAALAAGRVLVRTLSELFHVCHFLDDAEGMVVAAERASLVADEDDPEQVMLSAYLGGAARVIEGRPDLGAPLIYQAIDLLENDPSLRDDPRHLFILLLCSRWLMDPSVVLVAAERRISLTRQAGALGVLATALGVTSSGLAWMGDHVRAHAFAGEAVELLDALGTTADPGGAFETAATECALRGLHDEARGHLERARASALVNAFDAMPPHLAATMALCALCRGDLAEVVEVLEDQLVRFNGVGAYLEPLGVAPLLVEAYLGLARDDDARSLTARFRDAQPEQTHPHVGAMVARCEGLVAANIDEAGAAFTRALAAYDAQPEAFEAARTRLLHGMRLRRAGRRVDARVELEAARREFAALDLTLWSERCAHELAGTGERRGTREGTEEALTSQETRVALLAAEGLTNREIAAALFLSPKTVEHHLGAVLRKRGLRSRTELARALAAGAD